MSTEAPATIPALIATAAARFGQTTAVVDGEVRLTYAELLDEAQAFGAGLVALGVEPGDRVAIWAPNSARWIVALLGLYQAGAVLVPINTRFKGAEAADILERSHARVLVTVTDFLGTDHLALLDAADTALPDLEVIVVAAGPTPATARSWDDLLRAASDDSRAEVERRQAAVGPDDPADILFTSGTTGRPKGVVQTHARTLLVATDWVAMTGLAEGDRYLMVNPYFHMFGLKAGILASVAAGATMLPEPVFDVDAVLARVAADHVTVLPGAPTIYQAILDHPGRADHDLSSLRVAVTGAADIPVALIRRIFDELPFSVVITGYGLTEGGTAAATSPGDDPETIATTVGRPRPGFELRIVDDQHRDVVAGEPGEILLHGGSIMSHYLDDPEATAAAVSADGWLSTGDLGIVGADGCLRIVGRSKDMFIVGGFNAYPAEIENALLRHPDVQQVAVIGIPDARLGEVGMAFVVPRPGTAPAVDDIVAWSREQMANYKVPRRVELVDALPLNATGKVLKEELRARARGGLLHDALVHAAATQGDRVAVRLDDDAWSFLDLDRRSTRFAHHLARRGVRARDRVAMMTTNRVEFIVAVHALSKLGAAAVLLSPAWKAAEVDHAVSLTGPVHAVADGPGVELLAERLGADAVTDLDALPADPAEDHDAAPLAPTDIGPDDEAILVFSSGTTGLPKAVRHTHRSMGAATGHWVTALGLGPDDRFQVATPPSHILGLLNLLAAAEAGAAVRLHRRFDLDEVLGRIESDRITLEMAVAPITLAIAGHPKLEDLDLSSLRYIMWGATPVTASVAEVVTARTGVRWLPAYGASELPVIACNPVDRPDEWRLDSAGLPGPDVELRVVDLDTGAVLEPGGIGEIQAQSPSLMIGYLPDAANADAFVDGWYRTGDVGWLEPEGWVHLTDRSKEMIKVNGFQVAPAEVEAVLHGHPAVVDCAVFGIADERAGEVPVAAVQLDPDQPVDAAELQQLVADTLATYKQVRHVVVVDAIPRLPSGKVLRRTLRDAWAPQLAERAPLMDVRLSAEQRALRDSAVQLVGRLGPPTVAALDDRERADKLDAAVAAAGWRELRSGTDDGAPWASAVEVAIVAEELGRGLADAPFLGPTLAADLRRRVGAPAATGVETIALTPDLRRLGDGGAATVAVDAAGASTALVRSSPGDRIGEVTLAPAEIRTDLTRPMAAPLATADPAPLPDQSHRLTDDDRDAWTALGLTITCADLVGTMRGAIDLATGYAAERQQYGRPVGSFQAVQHLLADALVAMEGARSVTLHAAWAVDALPPADALAAGALAKAWCARAARSVCETAIQVHGGIGNTWDCLAHVHLRRALLSIDVLGGTGASLERVLQHQGIGGDDGLR